MTLPSPAKVWRLVKAATTSYIDDHMPTQASALAFYTIFSLAPLLVILVGLTALLFGDTAANGQLAQMLGNLMGNDYAATILTILTQSTQPVNSTVAIIFGALTLAFASTTVIAQLKHALNLVWRIRPKEGATLRHFIKTRLVAMAIVLTLALLLIISLIGDAILDYVWSPMYGRVPGEALLYGWINYIGFVLILLCMILIIYKVLPDIEIRWRDAFVGSVITTVLFLLGRFTVGTILGMSGGLDAYGAAHSVLVLLIWIYYNALIVFFGAEITYHYTIIFGNGYRAGRYARKISTPRRASVPNV
jgi:membrane protein